MSEFDERMKSAKEIESQLFGGGKEPPVDPVAAAYRMTDNYYLDLQKQDKAAGGKGAVTHSDEFEGACLMADAGMGEEPDALAAREDRIEELTGEIREYKQTAGDAVLEIGKRLKEAKGILPHGAWLPWLNEKVEFSERTAQNFMRLADAYANPQTLADLGASKALQLLALNPVDREEFMTEKHAVCGQEKAVTEMSSRELEQAIRERDEALTAKQAADEKAKAAQSETSQTKTKLETALSAANDLEAKRAEAEQRARDLQEKLKAAKDKAKEEKDAVAFIQRELEELKKKPVDVAVEQPSEEALEKLKADAEAAAAEKIAMKEAQLQAAMAQLKTAEEKAELAEKQLAMSDEATTTFKLLFAQWQQAFNTMLEALRNVEKSDEIKAQKLKNAIRAAAGNMGAA